LAQVIVFFFEVVGIIEAEGVGVGDEVAVTSGVDAFSCVSFTLTVGEE
jgi:hypothetical protein